jgi:DNA polymerase III subunit epsilon
MRQVVLDTETTGLEASLGHRIIEVGCVELLNRRATGRHFHAYLNPDREVDEAARAIHGMSREHLTDKPRFSEVAEELAAFIAGAELVIHNAVFDIAFLDAEYARIDSPTPVKVSALCQVLDTLLLAREMHPGQRNTLDALCKRYGVDNSHRDLHGALLDARILADVYLAMTGGQSTLALGEAQRGRTATQVAQPEPVRRVGMLRVIEASPEEQAAHEALIGLIDRESKSQCLWHHDGAACG